VKIYDPVLLVVVVCDASVPTSVAVTVAPGTAAPVESVTVPAIWPVSWEKATPPSPATTKIATTTERVTLRKTHFVMEFKVSIGVSRIWNIINQDEMHVLYSQRI
jgi:hypothetical protein